MPRNRSVSWCATSISRDSLRRLALTLVLGLGTAQWACGGTAGPGNGGTQSDCLAIDRVVAVVVPPAGLRIRFRLLACDGLPVRRLNRSGDVTVVDDESGEAFGTGRTAGEVSLPMLPSELRLHTVLALDLSDSVVDQNGADDVIAAARRFIDH